MARATRHPPPTTAILPPSFPDRGSPRECGIRTVIDMFIAEIIVGLLALAAIAASVRAVATDGYRRMPVDRMRMA